MNQVILKSVMDYDPQSGCFVWNVSRGSAVPGKIAGCYSDDGYIRIRINGCLYLAHRLAWLYMTGSWPAELIDHKNGIRGDNSWSNLREATPSQNQAGREPGIANQSGFKGVHFCNTRKTWIAKVQKDGKVKFLGYFATAEEASIAYADGAVELYGEYAKLSQQEETDVETRNCPKSSGWA